MKSWRMLGEKIAKRHFCRLHIFIDLIIIVSKDFTIIMHLFQYIFKMRLNTSLGMVIEL